MTGDLANNILNDPRFKGAPITWEATPEEYNAIRRAWLTHVAAEGELFKPFTEGEWRAQMSTMLSVFSGDCAMEIVPTGERWHGRDGAETFYRAFARAIAGMSWMPQALVIGPLGVLDVVNMTGSVRQPFAGLTDVGQQVYPQWAIQFPWIPEEQKFRGETVYTIRPLSHAEQATVAPTT